MDDKFTKNFPFASNYFSKLLETDKKRFPQSIVFEGSDVYAQCFFSLELARMLNCLEDSSSDCSCLNCRWIREGKHPAVNFISQLHYKSSDDDSKTVISVAQAKNIEKELRETSDYHRFFIFFDAKPVPCDKNAQKSIEKYAPDGYGIFSDNNWSMGHINQKTFNPSTPNVLLKSVEEPPERTTFVFLTKNRSDLINTIVSRSQCFKLPALAARADVFDVSEIFDSYPDISLEEAFLISERLQNIVKEEEVTCDIVLEGILAFLVKIYKTSNDFRLIQKAQKGIKYLSEAKKHLAAPMSERIVFDTLMLKIAKERA